MIQLPTKTELQALKAWHKPNSLTIYLPYIEPSSPNNNPNRIQLKVALKEAQRLLQAKYLNQREIDEILKPIADLIDSDEFLNNAKYSLAIFANRDFFHFYRLPSQGVEPYVLVNKTFKLQPILKLCDNNTSYYILSVSYNGVQLFKGDSYKLKKLKFQKIPTTMLQELKIDEFPNEKQLHVIGPLAKGRGSRRYHGQYNETQTNKDMLTNFFRRIDKKLHKRVVGKKTPLILAGVDYLLPLYRKINTYPYLRKEELKGSIEHTPLDVIREQVCKILA